MVLRNTTPAMDRPARTASTTVAPNTEWVRTSRTAQHTAAQAATVQRLRLRCCSGARADRRTASLRSVIDHRPRPLGRSRPRTAAPGRLVYQPRCVQEHAPVNESTAAPRDLEVAGRAAPHLAHMACTRTAWPGGVLGDRDGSLASGAPSRQVGGARLASPAARRPPVHGA